jgi:hypothetical protein
MVEAKLSAGMSAGAKLLMKNLTVSVASGRSKRRVSALKMLWA